MTDDYSYSQYLMQRSAVGAWYRRFLLYPAIDRELQQGRVLDFGCGIGDFLHFRSSAVGVDTNRYNCEYCRAQGHDVVLVSAGGALPFSDGVFDGTVLDNVLEHIPQGTVAQVVKELGRVIRREGRLVVGVPSIRGYLSDRDHKVYYTKDALTSLFERYGFVLSRTFYMPINSRVLDRYVAAHCLYAVFRFQGIGECATIENIIS